MDLRRWPTIYLAPALGTDDENIALQRGPDILGKCRPPVVVGRSRFHRSDGTDIEGIGEPLAILGPTLDRLPDVIERLRIGNREGREKVSDHPEDQDAIGQDRSGDHEHDNKHNQGHWR